MKTIYILLAAVLIMPVCTSAQQKAISLNGSTDYINCGTDASAVITGPLTIEAWIKPASYEVVNEIVQKGYGNANDNDETCYQLALYNDSGVVTAGFNIGNSLGHNGVLVHMSTSDLNKWIHIAGVYNDSTLNIYKNGVLMAQKHTKITLSPNSYPLLIGKRNDGFPFSGQIDEVRIWNIALTQADIQNTMYHELVGNEAGLVAYYTMDRNGQGQGLTVVNNSTSTVSGGSALNGSTVGTSTTPTFVVSHAFDSVSISISNQSIVEGNSGQQSMDFNVKLDHSYDSLITVQYKTEDKTAMAGTDYVATNGTLTFNPGETSQKISVLINGDTIKEKNETFLVILYQPVNAVLNKDTAIGTIKNDDKTSALTFNRENNNYPENNNSMSIVPNPAHSSITVNFTANDPGTILQVINATGQSMLQKQVSSFIGKNTAQLDISKLAAGTYMLLIKTKRGLQTKQFVKE